MMNLARIRECGNGKPSSGEEHQHSLVWTRRATRDSKRLKRIVGADDELQTATRSAPLCSNRIGMLETSQTGTKGRQCCHGYSPRAHGLPRRNPIVVKARLAKEQERVEEPL